MFQTKGDPRKEHNKSSNSFKLSSTEGAWDQGASHVLHNSTGNSDKQEIQLGCGLRGCDLRRYGSGQPIPKLMTNRGSQPILGLDGFDDILTNAWNYFEI